MAKQKISIKQISELTGYSVATVSRVINQNGRFSKETAAKIEQVIAEYGYVPDMAAKSLRTNDSHMVGIILPTLTNELFAKISVQIQSALLARGYTAVIYDTYEREDWTSSDAPSHNLTPILRALNVCGLVVISIREEYEPLDALGIPVVYVDCGNKLLSRNHALIEYDMAQSGKQIAQMLLEHGCRNIAAMTAPLTPVDCEYYASIAQTLSVAGLRLNCDSRLHQKDLTFACAMETVGTAWDSGLRFDGLILPKDYEAVAASLALMKRNIKIPQDVCLVGCDDTSIAVNTAFPLTTLHISTAQVGNLAASCLMDMLSGENAMERFYKLPLTLVERETT